MDNMDVNNVKCVVIDTNMDTNMDTIKQINYEFVLKFIKHYESFIDSNYIKLEELVNPIVSQLPSEIKLSDFYDFVSNYFASRVSYHPDYNKLASRICIDKLHKLTHESILDVAIELYNNQVSYDNKLTHTPLIDDKVYQIIVENYKKLDEIIDMNRDYLFDYFGIKTLERSYLIKNHKTKRIVERPQHMFMRVSIGIHHNDLKAVEETYYNLSNRYFTHATPTLFNAGTKNAQMSSCYLLDMEDDLIHIFKQIDSMAQISKWAGGIGVSLSKIRGNGSLIRKTNGESKGIIPLCGLLNKLSTYVNQGGKRPGSIASYLEPYHPDVFEFCELRKTTTGNDDNRARNLFLALWIPDLFMKRVENDEMWSLMCPDKCQGLVESYGEEFEKLYIRYEEEKKYNRQVKARTLWNHIMECQIETGMPYILFKDNANRKSNQKNLGTIKSSNLCVHEDTYILTKQGYQKIKTLEDRSIEVWNGEDWSLVTVRKTGRNKNLIRVNLTDGSYLDCTKEHKFYINEYTKNTQVYERKVSASELKIGDEICTIRGTSNVLLNNNISSNNNICKFQWCQYLWGYISQITNKKNIKSNNNTYIEVPLTSSLNHRMRWLEGYIDSLDNRLKNKELIIFYSSNYDFMFRLKLMLQLLNISSILSEMTETDKTIFNISTVVDEYNYLDLNQEQLIYELRLNSNDINYLIRNGFQPKSINFNEPEEEIVFTEKMITDNAPKTKIKIKSIEESYRNVDTYCFTEYIRNKGVFNGILTGQCAEIIEHTDKDNIAVCNLASICLPRYINKTENGDYVYDYDKLMEITRIIVRNLNKIIDLNYYVNDATKGSNFRNRPIGIGVQGLADVFCIMKTSYDSEEARILNKKIFETIYYAALDESNILAKIYGKYETFDDSPFSKGELQFHMCGLNQKDLHMGYDWDKLIEEIKIHGTRNSLLTALMPTAGTSQIMGCYESFEPYMTNIFVRNTMSGEFSIINEHLIRDLLSQNLWNEDMRKLIILNDGSIQNIQQIPKDIRDRYKTAFEMSLRSIIQQAIDRSIFVDQSQSMNLFLDKPNFGKLTKALFYGWKGGLKTGMYYLRSQPASTAIKHAIDISDKIRLTNETNILGLIGSDNKLNNNITQTKTKCKFNKNMTIEECMSCSG